MDFRVEQLLGPTYDGLAWLYRIRDINTGHEHLLYFPKSADAWWAFRILLLDEVV